MYARYISDSIKLALQDTPVVVLNGARQTGKSTLVKWLIENNHMNGFYNLDDMTTFASVQADPVGFISNMRGNVIIDEVQKIPELVLAIKSAVDEDRRPGRFLLTGSANVLNLPNISDSLAGRMEILSLWPLSQGEIQEEKQSFIDDLFENDFTIKQYPLLDYDHLIEAIIKGGYPEVLTRKTSERRDAWFNSYITALLQKDVKEIADIENLIVLPRLFRLLATRSATLLNNAELSRSSSIPQTTLKRYLALLETMFLINTVLPWNNNKGKRLVKAPKIFFNDTGLMSYLLNIDQGRLLLQRDMLGALLENFVVVELKKQITWSQKKPGLFHFRSQAGQEVDVILEDRAGRCIGIEVKSSSTVIQKDFNGLRAFAELAGKKFIRGVVLYTGDKAVPFGNNLLALPVNALWN